MRIAFLIIVAIHGLIHLLGFIKAFEIRAVKELTLPISKPLGLLWLAAAILFLLYGVLLIAGAKFDWMVGLVAIILSQFLVIYFWRDAKFGSIANVIALGVVIVSCGAFLINREFENQVKHDFSANNTLSTELLTESDLAHLPAPVQKFLSYTGSVGKPRVKNFRAEFTGGMRSKPDDKYMKLESVQYNFYQRPSRFFYMRATKMGLPAAGLHSYQNETATFRVKMLNWLTVVDARGDKMNQAETVTLFNDMCFIAPATLIDPGITWESIDATTVKAAFTNGTITITAILYFNDKGELVNFISNDRYETDGKQYHNYPWATPVSDYKELNGYRLPGKARLIYLRPDGDFVYGELEFKDVKYNLNQMED